MNIDKEKLFKYFTYDYEFKYDPDDLTYTIIYYIILDEYIYCQYEQTFNLENERKYSVTFDYLFKKNLTTAKEIIACIDDECKDELDYQINIILTKLREIKKDKDIQTIQSSITQLNSKLVNLHAYKKGFKPHVNFEISYIDYNITISFKIGLTKEYVVTNYKEFLRNFTSKQTKSYGKSFIFTHDINNLSNPSKQVINLLLNLPLDSDYGNKRYLKINLNTLKNILNLLKGSSIIFNDEKYTVSLEPIQFSYEIDKNYNVHMNHDYKFAINCEEDTFIFIDSNIYKLVDNENEQVLFNFFNKIRKSSIENCIDLFNQNVYSRYENQINIAPEIKQNFKCSNLIINLYFDYSNKTLSYKTKLYKDASLIDENNLNTLDRNKYNALTNYLENIGFDDYELKDEDKILAVLAMDFELLRKMANVYLSESIQNKQVVVFYPPMVRISNGQGIMKAVLDETQFNEDELEAIYKAIKLKKQYILLKNNHIIDLQNPENKEFIETIDDLKINPKKLKHETTVPIYQALLGYAHASRCEINEYLDNLMQELTNFKNQNYPIPKLNATLRKYQVDGFKWLSIISKYHMGGILADDMGLGKTIQMIALLTASNEEIPSLIVCPKTLIFNWKNEFARFSPNLKIKTIYGDANSRLNEIKAIKPHKKVIYITSYDSLRNDYLEIKTNFKYIVLDEAQYIKNVNAYKSQAVKALSSDVKFALTGTPIENNVIDLWSIFDFIMPHYFDDLNIFKSNYNNNENFTNKIAKQIAPFVLRRTKENVLKDLPSKFETIISVEMTLNQKKIYDAHKLKAQQALQMGGKAFDILPYLTRLRQICVDPRLFIEDYHEIGGKLTNLKEIIIENIAKNHRILIFSQFVKALNLIEDILKENNLGYYMITGETKGEDRIKFADEFNSFITNKPVFLISLKAGGTGLNLVGADMVIHLDPWWNYSAENQATDRAHRIGQKKNVEVIKLVCENTIEQRVIELQNIKKDIFDKLITKDENSILNSSLENINFILK